MSFSNGGLSIIRLNSRFNFNNNSRPEINANDIWEEAGTVSFLGDNIPGTAVDNRVCCLNSQSNEALNSSIPDRG